MLSPHSDLPSNFFLPSLTSYPTLIQPIRYDEKGRQIQYIESVLQRRERLAFLKKREWARRMAMWVDQTANVNSSPPSSAPKLAVLDSSNKDDPNSDTEPYIFYSSSPRTVISPPVTPVTSSPPSLPSLPPSSPLVRPNARTTRHRRRKSSLSSISEMPEED